MDYIQARGGGKKKNHAWKSLKKPFFIEWRLRGKGKKGPPTFLGRGAQSTGSPIVTFTERGGNAPIFSSQVAKPRRERGGTKRRRTNSMNCFEREQAKGTDQGSLKQRGKKKKGKVAMNGN